MSVPVYRDAPRAKDWVEIVDVGKEMKRVGGIGLIAGCMRLWVWVIYRGVESEAGYVLCSWAMAAEELRVSVVQVMRWKRELESVGWWKRAGTGKMWVHPRLRVSVGVAV